MKTTFSATLDKARKQAIPYIFVCSCILLLIAFIMAVSNSYNWQFHRVWRFIGTYENNVFTAGILLKALLVTIELIITSLFAALLIGIIIATMHLSASPVLRLLAQTFIGTIRNTPLLMQLYLVYFIFAPIFHFSPFWAATLALAFFEGAYLAEIFRAGLTAIPPTQWEAGFSLGMSTRQTGQYIILPQAVRHVLPSLTGQIVSLIKDTSLVSAISVTDITMRASEIISETYLSFEIWLLVAFFYLVLTSCISIPAYFLEKHQRGHSHH